MKHNEGYLTMLKHTNARKSTVLTGVTGLGLVALLTGCAAEDPADEPPADQEQTVEPAETPTESADNATTGQDDETDAAAAGDDPVYNVIDAVESEYADGFIIAIDRDDDGDEQYEVHVVVDNEVVELEVTEDGNVTVDEREDDDDDVAEADSATVTVSEALGEAFAEHADATFDEIELDEDDAALTWDVTLDGADGEEIELEVPATS